MRTQDLISALAADTLPQPPVIRQISRALVPAVAVSVVAFILFWGARPDIVATLGSMAVLKTLGPLALVALSVAYALALSHPGVADERRKIALGGALLLCALLFVVVFAQQGLAGLAGALSTPSLLVCLLSVPVLAAPLLAAMLWGLSSGASMRPRVTGAAAGLAAGGAAAALYSFYCDKDMVLFVLPAYSVAIGSVVLAGALLGPRALKW
ncbi:hypothetical protein ROE7235_02571 [Roseibaca ekhonensis]|jgi:hypothetical protein|uniref:Anti-sigma-F factor NrsF n=1 Tax=Roseinatronobacter ekhonensis TaxID=254356 RepID=A0A3B0MT53_9RHOB|nr:NrsF family protein [Roseibaca ekhonensis]SUZ32809.1 hypothetical protein ROE7235_02571 [Roseibaca ekhonensis]